MKGFLVGVVGGIRVFVGITILASPPHRSLRSGPPLLREEGSFWFTRWVVFFDRLPTPDSRPLKKRSPPFQGGGDRFAVGWLVVAAPFRRSRCYPLSRLPMPAERLPCRRPRLPDRGLPWVRSTLGRPQAFPAVASADFPIGRRLAMLPASRWAVAFRSRMVRPGGCECARE